MVIARLGTFNWTTVLFPVYNFLYLWSSLAANCWVSKSELTQHELHQLVGPKTWVSSSRDMLFALFTSFFFCCTFLLLNIQCVYWPHLYQLSPHHLVLTFLQTHVFLLFVMNYFRVNVGWLAQVFIWNVGVSAVFALQEMLSLILWLKKGTWEVF